MEKIETSLAEILPEADLEAARELLVPVADHFLPNDEVQRAIEALTNYVSESQASLAASIAFEKEKLHPDELATLEAKEESLSLKYIMGTKQLSRPNKLVCWWRIIREAIRMLATEDNKSLEVIMDLYPDLWNTPPEKPNNKYRRGASIHFKESFKLAQKQASGGFSLCLPAMTCNPEAARNTVKLFISGYRGLAFDLGIPLGRAESNIGFGVYIDIVLPLSYLEDEMEPEEELFYQQILRKEWPTATELMMIEDKLVSEYLHFTVERGQFAAKQLLEKTYGFKLQELILLEHLSREKSISMAGLDSESARAMLIHKTEAFINRCSMAADLAAELQGLKLLTQLYGIGTVSTNNHNVSVSSLFVSELLNIEQTELKQLSDTHITDGNIIDGQVVSSHGED